MGARQSKVRLQVPWSEAAIVSVELVRPAVNWAHKAVAHARDSRDPIFALRRLSEELPQRCDLN